MDMISIIWMAICAGVCSAGIGGLSPETPMWAASCIGVGIGWLFATLGSINNRLLK